MCVCHKYVVYVSAQPQRPQAAGVMASMPGQKQNGVDMSVVVTLIMIGSAFTIIVNLALMFICRKARSRMRRLNEMRLRKNEHAQKTEPKEDGVPFIERDSSFLY